MAFSPGTALEYLRRAHATGRLAHAYLITGGGERAAGGWRLALDLAKLVNGLPASMSDEAVLASADVHVAEPESRLRRIVIDQVRQLESALRLRAAGADGAGTRKIAILREADRLQPQAANAFLKTLEEPPANSLLLLVSREPEAMLDTILSRCIRVALKDEDAGGLDEDEEALLVALRNHAAERKPGLPDAYEILREFQQRLSAARARLTGDAEASLAADQERYGQTTGSGADYIEEREGTLKAQTEARYIAERVRLLGILFRWWGDVLRRQSTQGEVRLDFPAAAEATEQLAARLPLAEVVAKLARLETMRSQLETNVREELALEVAFLEVFGN